MFVGYALKNPVTTSEFEVTLSTRVGVDPRVSWCRECYCMCSECGCDPGYVEFFEPMLTKKHLDMLKDVIELSGVNDKVDRWNRARNSERRDREHKVRTQRVRHNDPVKLNITQEAESYASLRYNERADWERSKRELAEWRSRIMEPWPPPPKPTRVVLK